MLFSMIQDRVPALTTIIAFLLAALLIVRLLDLLGKRLFGIDNTVQRATQLIIVSVRKEFEPRESEHSRWSELIMRPFISIFFYFMAVAVLLSVSCPPIVAALHNGEKGIFPLQLLALVYWLFGLFVVQLLAKNGKREWRVFIELLHNGRR